MHGDAITPSLDQLKALTHPVRVRMLALLRIDGPATATMLAARLGLNTGATSYHLRQLAGHGFIVEDEGRGNARDRWWRAAHSATHAETAALPAGSEETFDAYLQGVVTMYAQLLQQAVEERPLLPRAWREVETFSDFRVRMTPERAAEVRERLGDLIDSLQDSDDPAAESVVLQLSLFPQPGRLGPDSDEEADA